MFSVTPTQSTINARLRSVLLGFLPAGIDVILGQVNRVAEPSGPDFVVFWPTGRRRISTNLDAALDALFVGAISGTVLTVSSMNLGAIVEGMPIYAAAGLADGTAITAFGTGTGGAGTYTVSPSQTFPSGTISGGSQGVTQAVEISIQCDVHGPASAENAQAITTLLRDGYAVDAFLALGDDVQTLHADDPKQIAFLNGESQWETRWVIEAKLQANQVLSVPLQFAGALAVDLIEVDMSLPP